MNRRQLLQSFGGLAVAMAVAPKALAQPVASDAMLRRWIERQSVPLTSTNPAAPLDDLRPLRRSIGAAQLVGLGESVHGAAEELALKHRVLRLLVEELGFRSVAWEED